MKSHLNRRDFLKLVSLLPFTYYAAPSQISTEIDRPNILIFVFDAFSGRNTTFSGYPRDTLPLTTKLAERATVYHHHFSGSNYTTPGTATLLTGTYPFTHRALRYGSRTIDFFDNRNIFSLFDDYYRISYTHNPFASVFLNQFNSNIDLLKPRRDLAFGLNKWLIDLFSNDEDNALLSWLQNIDSGDDGTAYSLMMRYVYERVKKSQSADFPRGLPEMETEINFYLEDAIDWTISELIKIPRPFLGYFHYFPPHDPYNTRKEYVNAFRKQPYPLLEKSVKFSSFFRSTYRQTPFMMDEKRRFYDEYILYADYEFNRLFNALDSAGILENTWVFFTSDHGELFEREKVGHGMEILYMPLVNVPLMVFTPGQRGRRDVFASTTATDLLPSVLSISGKPIPDWCEGNLLPQLQAEGANSERSIFAFDARSKKSLEPLDKYTAMLVKGNYKFHYYHGYEEMKDLDRTFELFDFIDDPEEIVDISDSQPEIAQSLLDEVTQKIQAVDAPYNPLEDNS